MPWSRECLRLLPEGGTGGLAALRRCRLVARSTAEKRIEHRAGADLIKSDHVMRRLRDLPV